MPLTTSTLHDPELEFEGRASTFLLETLIRAGLVLGDALLPGVLAVLEPDGLGSDSGRHPLPSPSVGGREDRRPPGTGRDAARATRNRSGHRADRGADELARRLSAPTD